jgi:hypothetical protein
MPAAKSDLVTRWFSDLRKRRAIKRYLSALPGRLIEDYGHRGPYTTAQVEASVRRAELSLEFVSHAQAIFCNVEELLLRHPQRDHFDRLRRELAWRYFGRGPGSSYRDVARYVRLHAPDTYPGYDVDTPVNSISE